MIPFHYNDVAIRMPLNILKYDSFLSLIRKMDGNIKEDADGYVEINVKNDTTYDLDGVNSDDDRLNEYEKLSHNLMVLSIPHILVSISGIEKILLIFNGKLTHSFEMVDGLPKVDVDHISNILNCNEIQDFEKIEMLKKSVPLEVNWFSLHHDTQFWNTIEKDIVKKKLLNHPAF